MHCVVFFEQKTYNGKSFEVMYLDFGNGVKVMVRDYSAIDKVLLIKSLKEVK